MKPKVSIIIPVYNAEKYLEQCLNSLINQTMRDIEIICVNDGSKDNSLNILEEYAQKDKRIKILARSNSGAAISRNEGYKLAQGEYVQFLDADDFFEPEMIEEMYNLAIKNDAEVAVCDYYKYDNLRNKTLNYKTELKSNIKNYMVLYSNNYPNNVFEMAPAIAWTKLIKKTFLDKYNIKFQNLKCCNDNSFAILTILLAKKIIVINKKYIYYRINNTNSISSKHNLYARTAIDSLTLIVKTLKKHNTLTTHKEKLCYALHRTNRFITRNCNLIQKLEFEIKLLETCLKEKVPYKKLSPNWRYIIQTIKLMNICT